MLVTVFCNIQQFLWSSKFQILYEIQDHLSFHPNISRENDKKATPTPQNHM